MTQRSIWARAYLRCCDWLERQRFAWGMFTAVRQISGTILLVKIERVDAGWHVEGLRLDSGKKGSSEHSDIYVAIRGMTLGLGGY